jgi:hypothetical protein
MRPLPSHRLRSLQEFALLGDSFAPVGEQHPLAKDIRGQAKSFGWAKVMPLPSFYVSALARQDLFLIGRAANRPMLGQPSVNLCLPSCRSARFVLQKRLLVRPK